MSYLTVGATTVSVKLDEASLTWVEVGSRKRADDGTMHSSVRDWKREWEFTSDLTMYDALNLEALLQGTPPLSCIGEFSGGATVLCHAEIKSAKDYNRNGAFYRAITFRLLEA